LAGCWGGGMSSLWFLAQVLGAIVLLWLVLRRLERSGEPRETVVLAYEEEPSFPPELHSSRGGALVFAEGRFFNGLRLRTNNGNLYAQGALPVPLSGRPDELYLSADQCIVPVDTKPWRGGRASAALSERIQLSVYRLILEYGYGKQVAAHGYIRRQGDQPGQIRYVKAELLSHDEVLAYYVRFIERVTGKQRPHFADNRSCTTCRFKAGCPRK